MINAVNAVDANSQWKFKNIIERLKIKIISIRTVFVVLTLKCEF